MKLRVPFYLSESAAWSRLLQFSIFAFLLFGIKLWVIGSYGNPTPFWDQWDAEAAYLYQPFLSHKLSFSDLFAAHNEHRIFTTRLVALGLLKINMTWNPMLQMVVNSVLHIIALLLGISFLSKVIGRNHLPALLVFSLILFGVPYSWENTLSGFQSQFYLVILFSIATLWLTTIKAPLTWGWWAGAAFGLLAFFSLASGVFAFGAAAFVHFIVFITNLRRTPKQLTALTILGILFLICIKLTPSYPGHVVFKAASFGQFYEALTNILAWPISGGFFSALFRNLPALIFVIIILKKPPPATDNKWFLLGLVFWSFGQEFSLAYGRASIYSASRYLDLFAIGILVNFACLLFIAQSDSFKWNYRWRPAVAGLWGIVVLFYLLKMGVRQLPAELAAKREGSSVQEQNTRNYLATGDTNFIKNKPLLQIPYPEADRLIAILNQDKIREILPWNINPGLEPTAVKTSPGDGFVADGYYPTTPHYTGSVWGSYNKQGGDLATGQLILKFDGDASIKKIIIPVAGYPADKGIKLEVEQNGTRKPVVFDSNPRESWSMAAIKVQNGKFSILASDTSKATWIAISKPLVAGRLDGFISRMLQRYYVFVLLGIMASIFLIIYDGFAKNKSHETGPGKETA